MERRSGFDCVHFVRLNCCWFMARAMNSKSNLSFCQWIWCERLAVAIPNFVNHHFQHPNRHFQWSSPVCWMYHLNPIFLQLSFLLGKMAMKTLHLRYCNGPAMKRIHKIINLVSFSDFSAYLWSDLYSTSVEVCPGIGRRLIGIKQALLLFESFKMKYIPSLLRKFKWLFQTNRKCGIQLHWSWRCHSVVSSSFWHVPLLAQVFVEVFYTNCIYLEINYSCCCSLHPCLPLTIDCCLHFDREISPPYCYLSNHSDGHCCCHHSSAKSKHLTYTINFSSIKKWQIVEKLTISFLR